jgi:TadE-like protein
VTKLGRVLRARRAGRDERGSVIVEAAIIVPLLIMLTFGAIEYGLAFRDSAAVASSTRAGARVASALTGDPPPEGALDGVPEFAVNAKLSVSDSLKDLTHSSPQTLIIYKADDDGNAQGGFGDTCSECYVYSWNAGSKTWTGPTNNPSRWYTDSEELADACSGTLPAIGVFVRAEHQFITKLFGPSRSYEHKTVIRAEPVADSECP